MVRPGVCSPEICRTAHSELTHTLVVQEELEVDAFLQALHQSGMFEWQHLLERAKAIRTTKSSLQWKVVATEMGYGGNPEGATVCHRCGQPGYSTGLHGANTYRQAASGEM